MKLAAIADVHGNYDALEAVLADIAALGISDVVNLGDHVSGPLEARRTAALLMEKGFPSIQGDQDRLLVEKLAGRHPSSRTAPARLDDSHIAWLASLPTTLLYRDQVLLCHGSPCSDAAYWLDRVTSDGSVAPTPIEDIEAEAAGIEVPLMLCGHTHIPRAVRLRDGRLIVNAGSVGLPGYRARIPVEHVVETGMPDACYAILQHARGEWHATVRYVPYDNTRMADLAARNGSPEWASALATGRVQ